MYPYARASAALYVLYSCALTQMWSYNCKPLTITHMFPVIAFSVIRIYDI